jgi:hypothetical protein
MKNTLSEKQAKSLNRIAKAFYQAYRLSGTVMMSFSVRHVADSDGNSVVDVYLSPQDREAAEVLWNEVNSNACHMQFLESMVPAEILGYQFILQITPDGVEDIHLEVLETLAPLVG